MVSQSRLESGARAGDSPLGENFTISLVFLLEYFEVTQSRRNLAVLSGKAKYFSRSIVNKYREGKVKSRPVRPLK